MLRKLLTCIFILAALRSTAQTYTYKPLALDTSSFWVFDYFYYDAGMICKGERISAVVGDTMIAGDKYAKIVTYTSAYYPTVSEPWYCLQSLKSVPITYVREDVASKKVFNGNGELLADFGRMTGDTIVLSKAPNTYKLIVDSVKVENYYGVDRRVQVAHGSPKPGMRGHFRTIEGVGVTYNFPIIAFGEWYTPVSRLLCYSKGGQVLYKDSTYTSSCTKLPPAKLSVAQSPALARSAFSIDGQSLRILNTDILPLDAQVIDMTGRVVRSYTISNTRGNTLSLPPAQYILRLTRKQESMAFLIGVQ